MAASEGIDGPKKMGEAQRSRHHLPRTRVLVYVLTDLSKLSSATELRVAHPGTLCPFHRAWGGPYLARFSRDVGYHEP